VFPVAEESEDAWISALLEAAGSHQPGILFPTQDSVVDIITRNSALLEKLYRFVLPPHPTVRLLADKSAFCPWAAKEGFPVPRTCVVRSPAELDKALRELDFPVVLKPFIRDRRWNDSGRQKAYRLDSSRDVGQLPFPLFDVVDRYIVQEWIAGNDADVYFCLVYRDRQGRELGRQVGRKLLQWPLGTGSTVISVTVRDQVLEDLTTRVFDAAGLVGLGSLEVKRDRRNGRYYITEPTVGRPDLQSNLATAAGVNLTALAYLDASGLPLPALPPARPAIWLNENSLPRALLMAARHRQLAGKALTRALAGRRRVMCAYWAPGDGRPLSSVIAGSFARRAGRPAAIVGLGRRR
jgi:predicted ATP-grasp superfamily ATP-dependent carboligase